MVTVYGTESGKLSTGKAYKVHKLVAEKLIAGGLASKSKPAAKSEKGGQKDA